MKIRFAIPLLGLLAACAEQPSAIEASYVSSNAFRGRTCGDLMAERNDIVRQVNVLTDQQKKAADTDAVLMGVGLVLFWPAILAVGATNDKSEALAAAKGNYNAVTRQMADTGCQIPTNPVSTSGQQRASGTSAQTPGASNATAVSSQSGDYWSRF